VGSTNDELRKVGEGGGVGGETKKQGTERRVGARRGEGGGGGGQVLGRASMERKK